MMRSFAVKAARRVLLTAPRSSPQMIRGAFATTSARAMSGNTWAQHEQVETKPDRKYTSAHVDAKVPPEDYYKGHLMADHLEYLDDVMEKTLELESSMEKLKETHAKKEKAYTNVGWMESAEIDKLFQESAGHKETMKRQIEELKEMIQTAKSKKFYGVDAPDGMADAASKEEMREVNHLIDEAAFFEDKEAVLKLHEEDAANRKVVAVDAPDGQPDVFTKEDLKVVNSIINSARDKVAVLQQREMDRQNRKITSVDAPDGMPDGFTQEELAIVKKLIDYAAAHEDKSKIIKQHKLEDAIRKQRARDPEHDW